MVDPISRVTTSNSITINVNSRFSRNFKKDRKKNSEKDELDPAIKKNHKNPKEKPNSPTPGGSSTK